MPLQRKVLVTNAAVLIVATLVLVLSPVTVSFPVSLAELLALLGGLTAMMLVEVALLRRAFGPLTRLAEVMGQEVGRLQVVAGLPEMQLGCLRTAPLSAPRQWDWMLELRPGPGTSAASCVDSQAWREWLGDLRLLGMRPTVLLADTPTALTAPAGP